MTQPTTSPATSNPIGPAPQSPSPASLPSTHVVLYDDQCPLCTFQMRVVTWLDWFNTVSLLPISHPRAAQLAPQIGREQLLEAIHCVTRQGAIHRGARAIRFIGMRMPLAIPVSLFLWFPGVIWIAEHVYMWISRNRLLLSRLFGCKEACSILPARQSHSASTRTEKS